MKFDRPVLVRRITEQLAIYNAGLVPSRFYAVLGSQPVEGLELH